MSYRYRSTLYRIEMPQRREHNPLCWLDDIA